MYITRGPAGGEGPPWPLDKIIIAAENSSLLVYWVKFKVTHHQPLECIYLFVLMLLCQIELSSLILENDLLMWSRMSRWRDDFYWQLFEFLALKLLDNYLVDLACKKHYSKSWLWTLQAKMLREIFLKKQCLIKKDCSHHEWSLVKMQFL